MNICLKHGNSDLESSYYVPGFQVNYGSSSSLDSEKSGSKPITSTPYNQSKTNRSIDNLLTINANATLFAIPDVQKRSTDKLEISKTQYTSTKNRNTNANQNVISMTPEVIADRCRVSFEGRGKLFCVEGHGNVNLRRKKGY